MNAILWPVFSYIAKNRWAQIVLGLGVFWLLFMAYLAMRDSGVRRVERERQKVESMKEQARVNDTVRAIEKETSDASHRADDAVAALPPYRATRELRDKDTDVASIVLGPDRKRSPESPRR